MKICTFFGHRELYDDIEDRLCAEIEKIIGLGVKDFYVGNNGAFDRLVYSVLLKLSRQYDINIDVILAYIDCKEKYISSIFPDGIEQVPKRFAIDHRNKWMVEKSEYVICYIRKDFGGAYKFVSLAKRKGKTIISL